jgi:hypothetical protein
MPRPLRSTLPALGCALALVALIPAAGLGAGVPHCSSAQLSLRFLSFQGATGHRFWDFAFQNAGAKCTLRGFPEVMLLDHHGGVLTVTFHHQPGFPAKTVTIAHGKRGFFTVTYLDGGFCSRHYLAYRMKLFPPGGSGGFVFNPVPANHGPISVCTGSERVYPVRATRAP